MTTAPTMEELRTGERGSDVIGLLAMAALGTAVFRRVGGALAGALAGVSAGLAMSQAHRAWSSLARVAERTPKPRVQRTRDDLPKVGQPEPGDAATVKAAEAIVGPLEPRVKPRAGTFVHYGMSLVTGAIYGTGTDLLARRDPLRGLGYGALVWLAADELLVPALGLSRWRAPLKTHVRGLVTHLIYGLTLDVALRGIRVGVSSVASRRRRRGLVRQARAWMRRAI